MLVWERIGCQLYSNAVVSSVTKDFKFVTRLLEYWMPYRCNINYVLSQDQTVSCQLTY